MVSFAAFVLLATIGNVHAAPAGKKAQAAPAKPRLVKFDVSVQSLPTNFSGSSIVAAFAEFRVAPKGEFETTDEYEARLTRVPTGTYAFVIPPRYTTSAYDADTGLLTTTPDHMIPADGYGESAFAGIELSREDESKRRYIGSNAYGASVQIEEYRYQSLSLITNLDSVPSLSVAVPRAAAPQAKQNTRVLVVVQLDEDSAMAEYHEHMGVATGFRHEKPTFDDPEEVTINDYSVRAKVWEFWLFDRPTGRVLGRFDQVGKRFDEATNGGAPKSPGDSD